MSKNILIGIINKKRAQVSIEFALAFILSIMLLVGIIKIFLWGTKSFTHRHNYFERTRYDVTHGFEGTHSLNSIWNENEATLEMDIFNEN